VWVPLTHHSDNLSKDGTADGGPKRAAASTAKLRVDTASAKAATAPARSAQISTEDTAAIERLLDEAKALRAQVELQNGRRLKTSDNDEKRVESVLLSSLTKEQLDPIYNALSKAAHTFPPDSAAEVAFRKRADEFVNDLLREQARYPVKVATKSFNKSDGTVHYTLASFSEDSVVADDADLGVTVTGKIGKFDNHPAQSILAPLFAEPPQSR
jgi:hypothetical protein